MAVMDVRRDGVERSFFCEEVDLNSGARVPG